MVEGNEANTKRDNLALYSPTNLFAKRKNNIKVRYPNSAERINMAVIIGNPNDVNILINSGHRGKKAC